MINKMSEIIKEVKEREDLKKKYLILWFNH
jgi:hypothetical protein